MMERAAEAERVTDLSHSHRHWFQHPFIWLGGHELALLLALAGVTVGTWLFVAIADEVMDGATEGFDRRLVLALRNPEDPREPIGPPAVREMARDVTALGGFTVLGLLTLATCGFLVLSGRRRMAAIVCLSVGSGQLLSFLLKEVFQRPRPDIAFHSVYVMSTSFPSGHSMMSAVTYLTLGALLARSRREKRLKAYFLVVSVLLTVAIGATRVYLGVHWPTDVLAGWAAGSVWALLWWAAARWLQQRRAVEQPNEVQP
jgi:undecaprenyl-diphosphatase